MKYQIITGDTSEELEENVTARISEGWKLQGGVSQSSYENMQGDNEVIMFYWAQAMIKE